MALIFLRSASVMVLALTAPSQEMGRCRTLFWRERMYVGGSSDMIDISTRLRQFQRCVIVRGSLPASYRQY